MTTKRLINVIFNSVLISVFLRYGFSFYFSTISGRKVDETALHPLKSVYNAYS